MHENCNDLVLILWNGSSFASVIRPIVYVVMYEVVFTEHVLYIAKKKELESACSG
jgi:hypothetical protein